MRNTETRVEGQKPRMVSQGDKDNNKMHALSDAAFAAQGELLYTVSVILYKNLKTKLT